MYFIREFKTGSHQTSMQSPKPDTSTCRFPSRPCTFPLFPTKITPLSVLPHLHSYSTSFICFLHISKSLFIGIYQSFYHFSYKKDGEYFLSFSQCCPFMAKNWRNFRSLYYSFLTVTLACHYWGFLCPPTGSEAPRTMH